MGNREGCQGRSNAVDKRTKQEYDSAYNGIGNMCLESWILIVQILVFVVLLITAIIAGKSARASSRAAAATEKSAESTLAALRMQCFAQLLDAYSSPTMLKDILMIIDWRGKHPSDWAGKYGQMIKDKDERKEILPIHEARRHYAHHFYKIRLMYESGYLDDNLLNKLATPDQIDFLLDTIEPLEKHLNPKYDDSTYRFFKNIRNK